MDQGLDIATRHFGNRARLAKVAGVTKQAAYGWQKVPAERVASIVAASDGALTRHDLRPDLWPNGEAAA